MSTDRQTGMQVTVTGGAGFIGANLVRAMRAEDVAVVVVDDLSTGNADNLDGVSGVRLVHASVLDAVALDEAMTGSDAVVHLAARPSVLRSVKDPVASHHANASGTLAVLEAARRHGHPYTVVASSSSVYGANPTLPKHEGLAVQPLSPYAASKLATESYALAYQACYGLPVLALRFFNVFGPFQSAGHAYAAVIPTFVDAALRDKPLPVHGDGKQTRDFTYVGSVCAVLVEALRGRVTHPEPVNLAFGSRRNLIEVIGVLEAVLDRRLEVAFGDPRPGDVRHSQADQGRLRALFPDIEPMDFTEGVRTTVDWSRSRVC